ncbi:nucleotide-binding alpha-beta plait domain-containing protein [Tanacetum coccineum]
MMTKSNDQFTNKGDKKDAPEVLNKDSGIHRNPNSYLNSYSHAAKKGNQSLTMQGESKPTIVLDETCVNEQDFSKSLMGKVKEFGSLSNLKVVLANEGFDNIKLKYMGGYWVLIEFESEVSKEKFKTHVGIGSWFSQIQQALNEFHNDKRVTWVDIEGIPLKVWTKNTFTRIASKWGDLMHIEDQEEDCFHSKRICIITKLVENIFESFKIIIKGKVFWIRAKEVPGWIPDFLEEEEEDNDSDSNPKDDELDNDIVDKQKYANEGGDSDVEEVSETIFENVQSQSHKMDDCNIGKNESELEDPFKISDLINKKKHNTSIDASSNVSMKYPPGFTPTDDGKTTSEVKKTSHSGKSMEDKEESMCSGHFKKAEIPRSRRSILQLMEEVVKVGQIMGYNMEGCSKNIEEIITSQRAYENQR